MSLHDPNDVILVAGYRQHAFCNEEPSSESCWSEDSFSDGGIRARDFAEPGEVFPSDHHRYLNRLKRNQLARTKRMKTVRREVKKAERAVRTNQATYHRDCKAVTDQRDSEVQLYNRREELARVCLSLLNRLRFIKGCSRKKVTKDLGEVVDRYDFGNHTPENQAILFQMATNLVSQFARIPPHEIEERYAGMHEMLNEVDVQRQQAIKDAELKLERIEAHDQALMEQEASIRSELQTLRSENRQDAKTAAALEDRIALGSQERQRDSPAPPKLAEAVAAVEAEAERKKKKARRPRLVSTESDEVKSTASGGRRASSLEDSPAEKPRRSKRLAELRGEVDPEYEPPATKKERTVPLGTLSHSASAPPRVRVVLQEQRSPEPTSQEGSPERSRYSESETDESPEASTDEIVTKTPPLSSECSAVSSTSTSS